MPHVVRGVVNDVDVRKHDHADDKKAQRHRHETLENDACLGAGKHR